jgi:DHA1 family L-arabinose/isopropyl-beta-D-thiogalactopyranoside export protein-like MFS transporter
LLAAVALIGYCLAIYRFGQGVARGPL